MNILALDLAKKTGWAHSNGSSGVWRLDAGEENSTGLRLIRLTKLLHEAYNEHGIDWVAYEQAWYGRPSKATILWIELQGVMKLFCEAKGINYKGYVPSEIKKHATGSGNAKKIDMIEWAEFKFKIEVQDDNEADALWILDLFKTQNGL